MSRCAHGWDFRDGAYCGACAENGIVVRSGEAVEPVDGQFVEPSTELDRPKPSVADFLQRVADDLRARRAIVVGTDMTFERMRIKSIDYDIMIVRTGSSLHPWK
jgi:hypothetical protein